MEWVRSQSSRLVPHQRRKRGYQILEFVRNNSDNKLQSDHLKTVKYSAGDLVRHSLLRAVNMKSIVL